jgi:hypothetical protein
MSLHRVINYFCLIQLNTFAIFTTYKEDYLFCRVGLPIFSCNKLLLRKSIKLYYDSYKTGFVFDRYDRKLNSLYSSYKLNRNQFRLYGGITDRRTEKHNFSILWIMFRENTEHGDTNMAVSTSLA